MIYITRNKYLANNLYCRRKFPRTQDWLVLHVKRLPSSVNVSDKGQGNSEESESWLDTGWFRYLSFHLNPSELYLSQHVFSSSELVHQSRPRSSMLVLEARSCTPGPPRQVITVTGFRCFLLPTLLLVAALSRTNTTPTTDILVLVNYIRVSRVFLRPLFVENRDRSDDL